MFQGLGKWIASVIMTASALCLCGCATITLSDGDGGTRVVHAFGPVSIRMCPETRTVRAKIRSFGLVTGPLGVSFGLSKQDIMVSSPSCKAVFWVQDEAQIRLIKELFGETRDICAAVEERKELLK